LIAAGQSIGNYRILNKIGTGGMGAVYLAEHPLIGKKVALKVIHRELATNREVVQRFFQEAKAVNKIGNEHIVEIHDFGITPEGDHFYIMEFLEGHNLAHVLGAESVLEIMRALHIGAQIASALAAAHASGVIHRDLKPDNVMLTMRLGDPDFVKLLDFGLAKMFSAGSASAVKTAAGVLLGTPQYMSPEACESRTTLDHRTDIYALGVLLFQMMTGVLPFDGETMGEVLVKQVTQLPPPPRGYNPNIPPSVEQIVLRCLMKQPDKRFPSMAALREALLDPENYLHKSPPVAPARSLAPGEIKVDAKTVMAYAAQEQKTRIGFADQLPIITPPSMPGTSPAASQATIIGDGSLIPPRGPNSAGRAATHGPDMAVPTAPKTNTMRIATPLGYSSRPPKRVWPIVLVVALLLGLGGGAFAVAYFGRKDPGAQLAANTNDAAATVEMTVAKDAAEVATPDAAVVTTAPPSAPIDAPPSSVDARVAAVAPIDAGAMVTPIPDKPVAVVVIDSAPQGAEVFGPDGKSAGKTPAKLSLPIGSKPLVYELRLAGYRKKTKQFIVTGNAVIDVPLERIPQQIIIHHPNGSGAKRGSSDDLERP
jgi:serine/threonine-protein kinase